MYSVQNCHNVEKYSKFNVEQLRFNVTLNGNAGCFKKSFAMVFQMLLCCKMDSLYAFKCKRFRDTRHTATFGI
jgi:hypothetical protein